MRKIWYGGFTSQARAYPRHLIRSRFLACVQVALANKFALSRDHGKDDSSDGAAAADQKQENEHFSNILLNMGGLM